MNRREIIAGLGSAVALPVVARAQQSDRVRRIGVLLSGDQKDPVTKSNVSAFTQALRTWVGPMAATRGWTFVGLAVTSIGYGRSRGSWSVSNPTSSWQARSR